MQQIEQSEQVAVYVRVSSAKQRTEGQEDALRAWVEGNGFDPARVRWYCDHESGKTLKRPQFEQMQGDIFDGKIKAIVVWKLDRVARSLRGGLDVLAGWYSKGLRVVVVSQRLDFSGAIGELVAGLLFGIAALETEMRAERQALGIAAAKRRGVYKGRKRGTTKASPKRAHKLRDKGLTIVEIAAALQVTPQTVHNYLKA